MTLASNLDRWLIWLLLAAFIVTALVTIFIIVDILAFGQTAVNGTTPSTTAPATTGEVQAMDISNDATIASVGGGIASGLVAEFIQRRKKTGKIDEALKEKDKLIDDLYDLLWMIVNKSMAAENAEKPFKEVILMKADPENNLDNRTIADLINQKRDAFKTWYKKRYVENPD